MSCCKLGRIREQSLLGLVSIALTHIYNDELDRAEDTLRGIIMSLDGTREKVGE